MIGIQEEESEMDQVPLAGDEMRSKTPIEEAPFETAGIIESSDKDLNADRETGIIELADKDLTPIQRIRKSRSQKSQMSRVVKWAQNPIVLFAKL